MSASIVRVILLALLVVKTTENSNIWRLCPPCRCFGDKIAECTLPKMNITLTTIPDFLSSEIEVLNITKHKLVTLPEDAFYNANLTNLWKVYLDKCGIKTIAKHAFRHLEQMTDLSLMYNEISELDCELFSTNFNLKYLWLDNNNIMKLPDGLCSELIYLSGFYARFNQITTIENAVFSHHPDLWIIDLSNNKLQYLNATIIENLKYLKVLFLHENLWSCDCRLKHLHKIMIQRNLYNLTKTVCASPTNLLGKELKLLQLDDFKCWQNTSIIPEQDYNIFEYNNTTLSCIVDALPEPQISWMYNQHTMEDPSKYIVNTARNDSIYQYNITILNVLSNDTGVYSCRVNNSEFETNLNINLTVVDVQKPLVQILQNYSKIIQSETENLTLSCRISGRPKPNVYWTLNNTKIINNNNFIISETENWLNVSIKMLNYDFKGQYSCNAKYSRFLSSQSVMLSVLPPYLPEVKISTGSMFKEETDAMISCCVKSYTTPTVIWKYNNNTYIHSNNKKYKLNSISSKNNVYWYYITIMNITSIDYGEYTCIAKSKEGESNDTYILTNLISKPKIRINTYFRKLLNTNAIVSCCIIAYPEPDVFWNFNTTNLIVKKDFGKYKINVNNITNNIFYSNLTIFNATLKDSGLYSCRANNTEGSAEEFTVLTVFEEETKLKMSLVEYIIIFVITGILIVSIIIILFIIYSKNNSSKNMANITGHKPKAAEDRMTEIPLKIYADDDSFTKNCSTKEEDIMYVIERDVTSYDVTEC